MKLKIKDFEKRGRLMNRRLHCLKDASIPLFFGSKRLMGLKTGVSSFFLGSLLILPLRKLILHLFCLMNAKWLFEIK